MQRWIGFAGCLLGLSWVAASALGAHVLSGLGEVERARYATALGMLIPHALALVLLGLPTAGKRPPVMNLIAGAFFLGSLLFCGSLIALALGAPRGISHLAPVGGVLLMLGWLLWGISFLVARGK